MRTAAFDAVSAIQSRMSELRLLAFKAKDVEKSDETYYNTLCRACSVLLASHLEGYVKDVTKAFVLDLNFYLSGFSKLPVMMQRAFCKKIAFFEGVPANEIEDRTNQLIEFFGQHSVPIDFTAFRYKENVNRNASPSMVDAAFLKVGVPNVIGSLPLKLNDIFNNDRAATYGIMRDMRRLQSKLYSFPYKKIPTTYQFVREKPKKGMAAKSIWSEYIDDILTRRHGIAHGDTLENDASWEGLLEEIDKMEVLMKAVAYSAADLLASP